MPLIALTDSAASKMIYVRSEYVSAIEFFDNTTTAVHLCGNNPDPVLVRESVARVADLVTASDKTIDLK